jgi:uncharacterized protein (TIGR02147 family)
MEVMPPRIYTFESASKFLSEAWKEKKAQNPSFSLRSWAKLLGFENNAPLSLILSGKRSVPRKYIPRFVQSLKLSDYEAQYLELLIDLEWARTTELKDYYRGRLENLRQKRIPDISEDDRLRFMKDPLHTALLEMTSLKDFSPKISWIRARLPEEFSREEIEEALRRMLTLGLLTSETDGTLKKTFKHLMSAPDEASEAAVAYHKRVSELASRRIDEVPMELRDFASFSFNLKKSQLEEAKKALAVFSETFILRFESADGEGDETYQLSLQLFPITR